MVGEVNKIIFNMLISGQGVYLPEIGTLYIERKGAKKGCREQALESSQCGELHYTGAGYLACG